MGLPKIKKSFQKEAHLFLTHLGVIQGDSKRLLKVHVSITSTNCGVGDLKFYTGQLQNYTIWHIRLEIPKRYQSIFKLVIAFLANFKKKPKFGTKFWQKTDLDDKKILGATVKMAQAVKESG